MSPSSENAMSRTMRLWPKKVCRRRLRPSAAPGSTHHFRIVESSDPEKSAPVGEKRRRKTEPPCPRRTISCLPPLPHHPRIVWSHDPENRRPSGATARATTAPSWPDIVCKCSPPGDHDRIVLSRDAVKILSHAGPTATALTQSKCPCRTVGSRRWVAYCRHRMQLAKKPLTGARSRTALPRRKIR